MVYSFGYTFFLKLGFKMKKFSGLKVKSTFYAASYGAGKRVSLTTVREENKRMPARMVKAKFNKFWEYLNAFSILY